MRFLHLSDLHLGKSIYGLSLIDSGDQAHWVREFLKLTAAVGPDAVVVAGDVYDRSAPSGAAVQLLSDMLTALSDMGVPVLMVSGNHDSARRLSFASAMLARQGLHISPDLCAAGGMLQRVDFEDAYGPVSFWLMPYVFPALAAQALQIDAPADYDAAVRALLARQDIDTSRRNVLVAHQNVTAFGAEAARGGSESMVGGVGQVEYTAFDAFDYVALGHIHSACAVGRPAVRYAGTPLCYHFDETRQRQKGPVLVALGPKGTEPHIETLTIPPLHPMREIRGDYETIRAAELDNTSRGEYLRVVLTDRRAGPEEADFLRALFEARDSRLLEIASEVRLSGDGLSPTAQAVAEKPIEALFADFYQSRLKGEVPDAATLKVLACAGALARRADTHAAPGAGDVQKLMEVLTGGGGA